MTSHTRAFFLETAKPTVEEFKKEPLNVRRGRLAAIVLFHVADYWWQDLPAPRPGKKKMEAALIASCPEFRLIGDVANASKHCVLDRDPDRVLSHSDQLQKTLGIIGSPLGSGVLGQTSMIWVTFDDSTRHRVPLMWAVRAVTEMWETKLTLP